MRTCFNSINCELHFIATHAPWMNAYIERFIGTTLNDLLGQFIPLTTEALRHALQVHVQHSNQRRTHQRSAGRRTAMSSHDRFSNSDGVVK